ncbi:MAG: ETX/MTX2 family pore-forming toxin, partial [Proteobacteria bacterium]|nr:ETX/MTX2 family pore-forming toxin [Pseudomonadota bacterium]
MTQTPGKVSIYIMDIFPYDIAEEMLSCAMSAGWSTSKQRRGLKDEAKVNKVAWEAHATSFKAKSADLLSAVTCKDVKLMFWFAAWHAANKMKGEESDAARDKKTMEDKCKSIVSRCEVTKNLAEDMKWMGWYVAWYCAYQCWEHDDDAKRNETEYKSHFNKIHGDVNLIQMNFFLDNAKIERNSPTIVAEQTLVNNSDIQQTMEFAFKVVEGKTESISSQGNFKFGVKVGFETGFFGFTGSKYELLLEISKTKTFFESISTGKSKSYKFSLVVPARSTYVAKGMVYEGNMEVPSELVFSFGSAKKSIYGIWKGVAVSTAT